MTWVSQGARQGRGPRCRVDPARDGRNGPQFLSKNFADVLFDPGQLLDARTHSLILPDGIGHGRSSKPSDGLRTKFPRYTYADMVAAQYRLLTEGLKVNHLVGDGHVDGWHARVDVGTALTRVSWTVSCRWPAFQRRSRVATGCGGRCSWTVSVTTRRGMAATTRRSHLASSAPSGFSC